MVDLADVDGDGDVDLVVVRGNTHGVVVFENDGAGHFAFRGDWRRRRSLAADVVDWDGDGDLDVATGACSHPRTTPLMNTRMGCPTSALAVSGRLVAEGDAGHAAPVRRDAVDARLLAGHRGLRTRRAGRPPRADYEPVSGDADVRAGRDAEDGGGRVYGDTPVEPDESIWLDLSRVGGVRRDGAGERHHRERRRRGDGG